MFEVLGYIYQYFSSPLGLLELGASIASLICVWQATQHNIWTWFWGTIGVILFGILFYKYWLVSDMILQLVYYLPMQYFGWKLWQKAEKIDDHYYESLKWTTFAWFIGAIFVLAIPTGYVMHNVLLANKSYMDALLAWTSVFAQYFLNRKYVQAWILWITVDILGIWIYFTTGLFVTSGLYVIFFILATIGLVSWLKRQKH